MSRSSAGLSLDIVAELLHVLAKALGGLATGGDKGEDRRREESERETLESRIHPGILAAETGRCHGVLKVDLAGGSSEQTCR